MSQPIEVTIEYVDEPPPPGARERALRAYAQLLSDACLKDQEIKKQTATEPTKETFFQDAEDW